MRPGPGLVVMALAFISGARRGSAIKGGSDWSSDKDSQEESLPKINPWLSACDLAQPSPDILQVYKLFLPLSLCCLNQGLTSCLTLNVSGKVLSLIFAPP
jgi:hypothetical protein